MFLAVQLWGVFLAGSIIKNSSQYGLPDRPVEFTWPHLLALIVGAVLLFLFIKYSNRTSDHLLKVVFALIVFSGSQITLMSAVGVFYADILALLLVITLFFFNKVLIHDIAVILTLIGIGTIFGLSLSPLTAVIILVVLSFYDIWSVYVTKHMIKIAQRMIQSGAIFGLIIPTFNKDFFIKTKDIISGDRSMILGSGDIVLPLILAASIARISAPDALIVVIFSSIGLWITHLLFVNQLERKPMAALPPIALMSILGYLFFILI